MSCALIPISMMEYVEVTQNALDPKGRLKGVLAERLTIGFTYPLSGPKGKKITLFFY